MPDKQPPIHWIENIKPPEINRWPENPRALGMLLATLTSRDRVTSPELKHQGYSLEANMQDGFRNLVTFLVKSLTGNTEVMDCDTFILRLQSAETQVTAVAHHLASILNNWEELVTNPNSTLPLEYKHIAEIGHGILLSYFSQQLYTQIGEELKLDPSLGADLQGLAKEKSLKLRTFPVYTLNDFDLDGQISSTAWYAQYTKHPREAEENANIQVLKNELNNSPLGTVITEISRPVHLAWQSELMLRFYTRTLDGWEVLVYNMPYDPATDFEKLMSDYRQNLNLPIEELNPESITLPMWKMPLGVNAKFLANRFPLLQKLVSPDSPMLPTDLLARNDAVLKPKIDQVMNTMRPVVFEAATQLPKLIASKQTKLVTEKISQGLDMSDLQMKTEKQLAMDGYDATAIAKIKSGELVKKAISSDRAEFNDYISSNIGYARVDRQGECGSSENSYGSAYRSTPQHTERSYVAGKNREGVELVMQKTGVDPKTGEGIYAARCPVCLKGQIDVCKSTSRCTVCQITNQDAHAKWKEGSLIKAQQSFRSKVSHTSQPKAAHIQQRMQNSGPGVFDSILSFFTMGLSEKVNTQYSES